LLPDFNISIKRIDFYSDLDLTVFHVGSLERLRAICKRRNRAKNYLQKPPIIVSMVTSTKFLSNTAICPIRQIASLVLKRGNVRYTWKVRKQWKEFTQPFEYQQKLEAENSKLDPVSKTITNVLFVSLT